MDDDATATAASTSINLAQRGRMVELLPIVLLNALLNIVTLTFYRFWGRTKVRQYLWQQTHIMDEPLEYTGTGMELFKGFVVVFFLILVPLAVLSIAANVLLDPQGLAFTLFSVIFYAVAGFLVGMAIYRARRYRLSRTVWRGIRAGLNGSSGQYALRYLGFWVLNVVTLGWSYPWMRLRLFGRIMGETTFGDRSFGFAAPLAPLYRLFAVFWLGAVFGSIAVGVLAKSAGTALAPVLVLLVPVLGWAWYRAREINHLAGGVSFEGLSFRMQATARSLLGLTAVNGLIVVLTLGFGLPFAQLLVFRWVCDHLRIEGDLDVASILQSSAEVPSVGEGLADAFDLGAV